MHLVFLLVAGSRLIVPLFIPRFPLPAVLGAFFVDAIDQTVLETFGGSPSDYQDYDKALDLYYLVIAYASTFRNWTNPTGFRIGQFLWYYRLIGTVAFALTGIRALLLIFPNTFEYFFVAYELVRTRWNPDRLGARTLIWLAAAIWIVIKLPQEYWIHVAQLDFTDEAGRHPWLMWSAVGLACGVVLGIVVAWHWLPRRDWRFTLAVDTHRPATDVRAPRPRSIRAVPFWSSIAEKVVLTSLMTIVFAEVLHARATHAQIVVGVAIFVVVNAVVSQLFAIFGQWWHTTVTQFFAMAAINGGAVGVWAVLRPGVRAEVDPLKALFLLMLLSLLITLYDRYRTMRERRLTSLSSPDSPPSPALQAGP